MYEIIIKPAYQVGSPQTHSLWEDEQRTKAGSRFGVCVCVSASVFGGGVGGRMSIFMQRSALAVARADNHA